jgi:hypothetical protein
VSPATVPGSGAFRLRPSCAEWRLNAPAIHRHRLQRAGADQARLWVEHALLARIEPQFSATLPRDHVSGIPLNPHVRPSRTPHIGHHGISGWHMHSL